MSQSNEEKDRLLATKRALELLNALKSYGNPVIKELDPAIEELIQGEG